MDSKPELISAKEAAEKYGCTKWYWRSLTWRGELSVVTLGRKHFLLRHEIENHISQNMSRSVNYGMANRKFPKGL